MSADRVQEETTLSNAGQVFHWNKRFMSPLGLWPMQRNNLLFSLTFGFYTSCMLLEYLDLLLAVNDLEHVVRNLTESMTYTQILAKFITIWFFNQQLGQLMTESMRDLDSRNYKAIEEMQVFMIYNKKSKVFVKVLAVFAALTASSYYLMPLLALMGQHGLSGTRSNNTSKISYLLPYQFHVFHRIENLQSYIIFYGIEFPFLFISYFAHSAVDSLMVSLVFHVCGQMSVLALRIDNINTDPRKCAGELKSIVREHVRLLRMGETIKETFSAMLLVQLVTTTILLCVLDYQILTNFANGDVAVLTSFTIYQFTVLLILYAQCTVGEGFLIESTKICEAFYNCKWYNISASHAKYIVLCMARSQEPLALSAGKFRTFCLTTLTDTVKASVAYLSFLRSFL